MNGCEILVLECALGALAGVGVAGICWRIRRPLRWAQQFDHQMTEHGLYKALPIYGFLRRYLLALLFAGLAIILMNTLVLVLVLGSECSMSSRILLQVVLPLLIALLCIHMAAVTLYEMEIAKHRQCRSEVMETIVRKLRNRLWGAALFLLLETVILGIVGGAVT